MIQIPLGTDLPLVWSFFSKDSEGRHIPYVLEGRDIQLVLKDNNGVEFDFTRQARINDNRAAWTFRGSKQRALGIYGLTAFEREEDGIRIALDSINAFEIVSRSERSEGGTVCGESSVLEAEPLQLFGLVNIGTNDYDDLEHQPSINGVTLEGNKTTEDLHIPVPHQYESVVRKGGGFYAITYDELDYDHAKAHFDGDDVLPDTGGCSVRVAGDIVGRNYDWLRNGEAVFEIHTSAAQGRFASYGFGSMAALTVDRVESRERTDDYKLLPFLQQDGVNSEGLFAAILVVPASDARVTVPLVEKRERICSLMLVRYILDRFGSVDEAVAYLRDYVEIYQHPGLTEMGFEPHFVLKDGTRSVVLEFTRDGIVTTASEVCTNFRVAGVRLLPDGGVYTNADAAGGNLPSSLGIESHGTGLERWNILARASVSDADGMRTLMDSVHFSKAYTELTDVWYSDFVGGAITVDTPSTSPAFTPRLAEQRAKYLSGSDEVWITKQSCVYDVREGRCRVSIREGADEYTAELMSDPVSKAYVDSEIARLENNFVTNAEIDSLFEI